ncbi:threonine aldolase family protein [Xanthomonas campestris]|uniref:threonine aldolase family protein n=2 Tax=Pseudomonadati TaxID=3379134 RepID=UPI00094B2236|nr:aminotransferase class I/II-fold pyridoxal phosphate-dependent enzyme [Xanthomonas campestris]MEB1261300.1 aminotransferase class I/II-fold pyridoxal phosphate-dependent enzyme [Xanthomonas campestris pv. campestris]MEB1301618.1 aminotransferase class I/II-fold pyridoxal phosphate-dependent enzyme [Xanthomonas campestris pv. campestris]MEB1310879.1 aminotransferase class I/II-fold pyridoxal phosphate-dependent enzyme [Xanthomonas campestris pv. campestris]MEB1323417.1 aminotransferase class 
MDGQGSAARISFRNDYSEGAHPRVLQALAQASAEQNGGYGTDRHSERAAALICNAVAQPQAAVHLLVGGTQTNLIAISAFLRSHQAVIAVEAGHIATHETGAIEATGHKVLTVPALHDKLTPALIAPVLAVHSNEHMVQPRLVYLSNSTESGTIYTRAELEALAQFCRAHDLLLYLDGARLGAALTADGNDLDLPTIAALTDAFYIGGTKNGALLGEALVIVTPALQADFRYLIKQRGALLAKGMVLGAQFAALFEDGLFFELATHANAMAQRLRAGLLAAGAHFTSNSPTNQQFIAVTAQQAERLTQRYDFERWETRSDGRLVIRFVTSWATTPAAVDRLCADVAALVQDPKFQDRF